jgi:hypothetical protein
MRAVRYRADMSPGEKRKIWEALERGLRVIAQSSGVRSEEREPGEELASSTGRTSSVVR